MKIFSILLLASISTSCATVRVVNKRPGRGGTIAVQEGFIGESADVKARRLMSSNCRRGFKIISEGEHKVGSTSSGRSRDRKLFGIKYKESEESTVDVNEWRVKYRCKRSRRGR